MLPLSTLTFTYRAVALANFGACWIAVARSVDNDDDARWLAERLHRSFGGSVDVNSRFLGWLLLVIGAGPVKLSIAQHDAALGENGTLQFCDSLGIGPIR